MPLLKPALALTLLAGLIWLPAYSLACICIGGPIAILAKYLWDCHREAKEYNDEHDL